ncbi:MAG: cupin domain-containing protein [Clostridiaceae bacterium]
MTKSVYVNLPPTVHRDLLVNNSKCSMTKMNVEKNTKSSTHSHPHFQIVYLLEGSCDFLLNGEVIPMVPGQAVYVESNALHGFCENTENLTFVEFFVPGREDF